MKPSEVFGIVVRTVGLLMTLIAAAQILVGTLHLVLGGPMNPISLLVFAIPALLVGLWFLRGAESLVRFAFPAES